MEFIATTITDVFIVQPDVFPDERGVFSITWLPGEFAAHGLETRIAQASSALTRVRGSIRGLHYQAPPFEESKLVRVTKGSVFDVAVDLRPDSPTYLKWVGCELSMENRTMLHLPPGCAHGYQTLEDDTEVFYFVSAAYSLPHQRGVRWDDPAFGIDWPLGPPARIHPRDAGYPLLDRTSSR